VHQTYGGAYVVCCVNSMFEPLHPGLTLRDNVLPALGLSSAQAAKQLNVSHVALSRVLNGWASISPEMALRIEAWLGIQRGGDASLWLAEQSAYDVWQAEQRFKLALKYVQPAPAVAASLDETINEIIKGWKVVKHRARTCFSEPFLELTTIKVNDGHEYEKEP